MKKKFSIIHGKKILDEYQNFKPDSLYDSWANKKYESFIIEKDENGEDVVFTSNPDQLANYFGKNPDAPHYLTPIFFKSEVLSKYYSNPDKYYVGDGGLGHEGFWSMRIDNNIEEYISANLGDLGRDLPHKEQLYWKSFNFLPENKKISNTKYQREILGEFEDPTREDLLFKMKLENLNERFDKEIGWKLFKKLAPKDEHHLKTLRIPLTEDQQEFDQQVLSFTKVFVDSINEKEISKFDKKESTGIKGISKLENSFKVIGLKGYEKHIKFLRDLQDLRSSGSAHRKSKNFERISRKLGIVESNLSKVIKDFFIQGIGLVDYLDEHFEKIKTEANRVDGSIHN